MKEQPPHHAPGPGAHPEGAEPKFRHDGGMLFCHQYRRPPLGESIFGELGECLGVSLERRGRSAICDPHLVLEQPHSELEVLVSVFSKLLVEAAKFEENLSTNRSVSRVEIADD
jgi:hypothetical protein